MTAADAPAPATGGMLARPGWTDSHCHLQDDFVPGGDAAAMLGRAAAAGVERAICVGTNLESSEQAAALAGACAADGAGRREGPGGVRLWASVGLHPHDASEGVAPLAGLARKLVPAPGARPPGSVVAVGECGLDYHYDHSPRPVQRAAFADQVALARELDLALVVHTREAWDDTLAILADSPPGPTVLHCFTGGSEEARRCLDLGAYLSFSGIVTFKNAEDVREAARMCPPDRMLVETDSPFLAPVPHRGRQNEPAYVALVGAALADLVGMPIDELAERTSANAAGVFSLSVE